jgi:hypothetical protein
MSNPSEDAANPNPDTVESILARCYSIALERASKLRRLGPGNQSGPASEENPVTPTQIAENESKGDRDH